MNIILFGPPGAGKGTQADQIAKNFNLHKVSTGDLLRNEIKNDTELGIRIKSKIDNGKLVSDDIIMDLIDNILSNENYSNRLIFDGCPRNLTQAKELNLLLKKYGQKISLVFNIDVNKEIIIKRVLGRIVCTNCGITFNKLLDPLNMNNHDCDKKYLKTRPDDNNEVIINRFETYVAQTLPILEYYSKQKILKKIDGTGQINDIYGEISSIMASLET